MDDLGPVLCGDEYTEALTLGPNFACDHASISVGAGANDTNAVLYQVAQGVPGDWRWTDEREFTAIPQAFAIGRIVGIRFRNKVPGVNATVQAFLMGRHDPDIAPARAFGGGGAGLQVQELRVLWNDPALLDGRPLMSLPQTAVIPNYYEGTAWTYHFPGEPFDAGTLLLGIKVGGVGLLQIPPGGPDYLHLAGLTEATSLVPGGSLHTGLAKWEPSLFATGTQLRQFAGGDTVCVQSLGSATFQIFDYTATGGDPPGFITVFGDRTAVFAIGDEFYVLGTGVPGLDGRYTVAAAPIYGGNFTILYTTTAPPAGPDEPNGVLFKRGMLATQGHGAIETLAGPALMLG